MLIFGWLIVAPLGLAIVAIIVRDPEAERTKLTLGSPYVWLGAVILLAPVVLLIGRWLRSRRLVAAELDLVMPRRPLTRGERIRNGLLAGFCFLVGAGFLVTGYVISRGTSANLRTAARTVDWPRVSGVITESRIEHGKRADGSPGARSEIRYEYVLEDGTKRVGFLTSVPLHDSAWKPSTRTTYGFLHGAIGETRAYPVGKAVQVAYDPLNPSFAVLETGISPMGAGGLGTAIVFTYGFGIGVIGIGLILLLSREVRRLPVAAEIGRPRPP
jgi:hypothetical protein